MRCSPGHRGPVMCKHKRCQGRVGAPMAQCLASALRVRVRVLCACACACTRAHRCMCVCECVCTIICACNLSTLSCSCTGSCKATPVVVHMVFTSCMCCHIQQGRLSPPTPQSSLQTGSLQYMGCGVQCDQYSGRISRHEVFLKAQAVNGLYSLLMTALSTWGQLEEHSTSCAWIHHLHCPPIGLETSGTC